ncbi:MAG: phosphatidylcholine/phosphatidylserine synthase [Minwuiales bacterium]|nr:phosphatidylcholine/phosphatidylserine synthase [Minwuiales bacterium]
MRRPRRRRLRNLPINSLLPNMLTVLALCAGLTSMRFALQERWEMAVGAIVVAAILDGLDGRLARLLKGASKFGAELDSLSDFVCFGVAPAFVLHQWTLFQLRGVGWILVLGFAVCCALRLARFNTALEDPNRPAWSVNYFTGVAAPAGAGLALIPVMLSFLEIGTLPRSPYLAGAWMAAVAFLMVSQIPTYSFKKVRVRRDMIMPMLLLVALGAAALAMYPWITLSTMATAYLVSIPFAFFSHAKLSRTGPEDVDVSEAKPAPRPEADREGDSQIIH